MSQSDFKSQMVDSIIPSLLRMIEKEKDHLRLLQRYKAPEHLIDESKEWLSHYEKRHKEYVEFVNSMP